MKYISVLFLVGFFIYITIVGLRDCEKPIEDKRVYVVEQKPEPFVLVDDIIFEVFMGEDYDG